MICKSCLKRKARFDETFGCLPCLECSKRQDRLRRSRRPIEFTSESIKSQRKEFAKDIVQPYRKGQLSKEYVELYGTKHLNDVTPEEAKSAKYVWKGDTSYYKQ